MKLIIKVEGQILMDVNRLFVKGVGEDWHLRAEMGDGSTALIKSYTLKSVAMTALSETYNSMLEAFKYEQDTVFLDGAYMGMEDEYILEDLKENLLD